MPALPDEGRRVAEVYAPEGRGHLDPLAPGSLEALLEARGPVAALHLGCHGARGWEPSLDLLDRGGRVAALDPGGLRALGVRPELAVLTVCWSGFEPGGGGEWLGHVGALFALGARPVAVCQWTVLNPAAAAVGPGAPCALAGRDDRRVGPGGGARGGAPALARALSAMATRQARGSAARPWLLEAFAQEHVFALLGDPHLRWPGA